MDSEKKVKRIKDLLFSSGTPMRTINLITLYRIVTFPLLLLLLAAHEISVFKWLLALSFFTDAIDGYLARKYNVASALGAKLDSIGDDLTVLAGIIGLWVTRAALIREQHIILIILFGIFLIQVSLSLIRYGQMSSFHTYLAKIAAFVSAFFLLSTFFFEAISYPLFYAAIGITALELMEEIVLVLIIPRWKANVKGLYWALHERGKKRQALPHGRQG